MIKIIKILFLIFTMFCFFGCSEYNYNEDGLFNLRIDKIKFNMVYDIGSINEIVDGVVMFDECGRPDINNSNTVIGAHSGSAKNAYFNEINRLEKNDKIELTYNRKKYIYLVSEVKEINDTDIYVLDDTAHSMLTLLTCKIGDVSKRIIVISYLING